MSRTRSALPRTRTRTFQTREAEQKRLKAEMERPLPDHGDPLRLRCDEAVRLIQLGELDPIDALIMVVHPSESLARNPYEMGL